MSLFALMSRTLLLFLEFKRKFAKKNQNNITNYSANVSVSAARDHGV
jgi:hypothetical protein